MTAALHAWIGRHISNKSYSSLASILPVNDVTRPEVGMGTNAIVVIKTVAEAVGFFGQDYRILVFDRKGQRIRSHTKLKQLVPFSELLGFRWIEVAHRPESPFLISP